MLHGQVPRFRSHTTECPPKHFMLTIVFILRKGVLSRFQKEQVLSTSGLMLAWETDFWVQSTYTLITFVGMVSTAHATSTAKTDGGPTPSLQVPFTLESYFDAWQYKTELSVVQNHCHADATSGSNW